ncbi:uncharacterized protein LOC124304822 isoform X1 [Neodiprion virginianus]|uniref:uncharacterized protein LOC124304822 isoform X1 n=1 Tax=Neodiprion virginianus TaxID=2961670 RepID=UPI001EE69D0A|nr:uncharacterized protein LOC124304822 isoform X1 [Neodiprion virginianus]
MRLLIICSVVLCLAVLQAQGDANSNKISTGLHSKHQKLASHKGGTEHVAVKPLIPMREKQTSTRKDLQSLVISKIQDLTNAINKCLIRIHDFAEKIGFNNVAKLLDDITAALQDFAENINLEAGDKIVRPSSFHHSMR